MQESTLGSCGDNLIWDLGESGVLTITGRGSMYDFGMGAAPWFEKRSLITRIIIQPGVTSIGAAAFYDCQNLTSVTLPDGMTKIGNYAFNGCGRLTGVTLPDGVTSIGYGAFYCCESLAKVTIPDSMSQIGGYAFSECGALESVTISDKVTAIGEYAFAGCTSLTSVTLPDSVKSIGEGAFMEFSGLQNIVIPCGVTEIGWGAFAYCYDLQRVTFVGDAPAIGDDVFCEVAATCYYSGGNVTWNDAVLQNYGGELTWIEQISAPEIAVSNVASSGKPKLSWKAVTGAVKYKVYRSTAKDGTYSLLKTVTGTTHTNTGATAGTTYYYKVIAVHSNTNANSADSNIVSMKAK